MDEEEVDEWAESEIKIEGSLFQRREIEFSNRDIEQNIDSLMENPILNLPLEHYATQEDADENLSKEAGKTKESEKQEALYNPIEDEENENWMKKHCKKSKVPLNCPSCFNQLAYDYQMLSSDAEEKSYTCREVFGVEVKENKIIRSANLSEFMNWEGTDGVEAEKNLREREEAINVKILAQCSCGYSIGYFDINKQCYVLTNVL